MKVVIQKVKNSRVEVQGKITGEIDSGLNILLGINTSDTDKDIDYLVEKIVNLRLFENKGKSFDQSIVETSRNILLISQFTLYSNCLKGRRPDFTTAAKSDHALPLYQKFIEKLKDKGINVQTGEFGADMEVYIVNDGPITIILESPR